VFDVVARGRFQGAQLIEQAVQHDVIDTYWRLRAETVCKSARFRSIPSIWMQVGIDPAKYVADKGISGKIAVAARYLDGAVENLDFDSAGAPPARRGRERSSVPPAVGLA
jgi:hypothetical protein